MSGPTVPRSDYRVVILDDHALFAESLELALGVEGYTAVRPEPPSAGTSGRVVVQSVLKHKPNVVLLDLHLGDYGDSDPLIRPLAEAGVNVVVVSSTLDPARLGGCIERGARAVVSKDRRLNEILAVVRRLRSGLPVLSVEERESLVGAWRRDRADSEATLARLELLSAREREVLADLMAGRSVREIAERKVVSEATVRTQVKAVLAKLEVGSQLAAVGLAHRVGWRPPSDGPPGSGTQVGGVAR